MNSPLVEQRQQSRSVCRLFASGLQYMLAFYSIAGITLAPLRPFSRRGKYKGGKAMKSSRNFTGFPFSILLTGPFEIEIGFSSDQTVEIMNATAEAPAEQSYVTIMTPGSGSETLPLGLSKQQVENGSALLAATEDTNVKIILAWKDA